MALGFGRGRKVDHGTQNIIVNNDGSSGSDAAPDKEKSASYGGYDPETGGERGRKMSRIGGALNDSDQESQLTVGKQLELEQANSIKYRTCSWQKVIRSSFIASIARSTAETLPS